MQELNRILNCRKELMFLDFEGTQYSLEIIAIGAIKVTLDSKNHIKTKPKPFKVYIKSKEKIGSIVEKLTGIDEVFLKNNGIPFKEAIEKFKRYCGKNYNKYLYVTYGNFDKKLLSSTANLNDMIDDEFIKTILKNSWDISQFFSKYIKDDKGQQLSLKESLDIFHVSFNGTEHDPADDAINLMLLYEAFITKKNILFEEYKKYLNKFNRMPRPLLMCFKKLKQDGVVTIDDYDEFIKEDLK